MSSQRAHLQQALGEHFRRHLSTYSLLFHQAVAGRLGLHVTDFKCLDLVRGETGLTPGRLAELTGLTTAAVTSILGPPRTSRVCPTGEGPFRSPENPGKATGRKGRGGGAALCTADQALSDLFEQYTTEELTLLNEFALRVGQILHQETARLRTREQSGLETTDPRNAQRDVI